MVGDGDNGHFNPIAKFQLDVTKPSTDKIFLPKIQHSGSSHVE